MSSESRSSSPARRKALLFSGHMIDAPGRIAPRFPPEREPDVRLAIESAIATSGAGSEDVAIAAAACGGDILFDEVVLQRGIPLRLYLPFDEPTFIEKSVAFADDHWVERYRRVVACATLAIATEVLGPLPAGEDPFERANLWMLAEAQRLAPSGVIFVSLWNGEGGDGPGGTKHMMDAVRSTGGQVHWIDIRRL